MNTDSAVTLMLERFPSLRAPMKRYIADWERDAQLPSSPGVYNLFGDVVFPRLIEPLLNDLNEDSAALKRVFDAIELMAAAGDEPMQTFVRFGICERLGDNERWLARARFYMGPTTRAMSDSVEKLWGRSHRGS